MLHLFKRKCKKYIYALYVHVISGKDLKKLKTSVDPGKTDWTHEYTSIKDYSMYTLFLTFEF